MAPLSFRRRTAAACMLACLVIAACGTDDPDDPSTDPTATNEAAPSPEPASTTGAPTTTIDVAEDTTTTTAVDPVIEWAPAPTPTISDVRLVITERDRVRVHTFVIPELLTSNAVHAIETENAVVVVDGLSSRPYAESFRAYVDALGKPVERVILSHGHPDHWFGVQMAWADHEVWADQATIDRIAERGQGDLERMSAFFPAEELPDELLAPTLVATDETFEIDGVTFEQTLVASAEAPSQIVIELPEARILVAQDLVYSDGHLFMGNGAFDEWIAVLQGFADALDERWVVLAGHGLPTDESIFGAQIAYLAQARDVAATAADATSFVAAVTEIYPDLPDALILQFGANQLFCEGGFAASGGC